jgi:hypothetical protein
MSMEARTGSRTGWLRFAAVVMISVQSFVILAADPWFGFAALLVAILVIYALATNDVEGEGFR